MLVREGTMKAGNAFVVKAVSISLLVGIVAGFMLGQKYSIRIEDRSRGGMLGVADGGVTTESPASKGGSSTGGLSGREGALVEGQHCVVSYDGVEKKRADAFAKIYDAVYQGYADVLGMALPETTYIEIT